MITRDSDGCSFDAAYKVKVKAALSRDLQHELENRGYWVIRNPWSRYKDRFRDSYFFNRELGYSKFVAFLGAL